MKTTGRVLAIAGLAVALGFAAALTVKAAEQPLDLSPAVSATRA